jgi:hypothetical protein
MTPRTGSWTTPEPAEDLVLPPGLVPGAGQGGDVLLGLNPQPGDVLLRDPLLGRFAPTPLALPPGTLLRVHVEIEAVPRPELETLPILGVVPGEDYGSRLALEEVLE